MLKNKKHIILASPRGFCAGVVRAIETVRLTLEQHGAPVYVLHEIVHNKHVLQELERLGAIFVERLADIPPRGICIFSAHGVSAQVEERAKTLGLRTIDATCPLVSSVHRMVEKFHGMDYDVVIIGHHRHPEVEGTAGRVRGKVHIVASPEEARELQVEDPGRVAFVTQTTLSEDDIVAIRGALFEKFPSMKGPVSNICYATQNRQNAVKKLAEKTDLLLVVGSKNSSNSNRLREVGLKSGIPCYLIDDKNDIDPSWLEEVEKIGVTAGASAPERLVEGVIAWMQGRWEVTFVEMEGKERKVQFKPAELVDPV
ncbi:MAG: 4-hydroxy-3-methylbut-2-enyl diphosphate reductase [Desulfocapsaceae bacterium]|nr:4-hydroxy-3-methylbut-2-enyl diphosphate reductase [Desulfocapsaceae bacterium]